MYKLLSNVATKYRSSPNKIMANFSSSTNLSFETLAVTVPHPFVYHVELNRPKKYNSVNPQMWKEIKNCFENLHENPECRVVILSANGKYFCAGIDLFGLMELGQKLNDHEDIARKCKLMENNIRSYQDVFTSLEKCDKPIISAIHSGCIGAGVDMISSSDIRVCSEDAWFQIKEVAIGMAADVGTLQRFPKIVKNQSLVNELCLTARKFDSKEAHEMGFVSRIYENKEKMLEGALELAKDIASKSPVAVQTTKKSLVYSRDHTAQEGLDHIRLLNMSLLQSEDFINSAMAAASKGKPPEFSKY